MIRKQIVLGAILALLAVPGKAQQTVTTNVLRIYDPPASEVNCAHGGISPGRGAGTTGGASSATVTDVESLGVFSTLAAGDTIYFKGGGVTSERSIVTPGANSIVLDSVITIPAAGNVWDFRSLSCGATIGYFSVSGLTNKTIMVALEAGGDLLFSINCSAGGSGEFQIHPDNSSGAVTDTLTAANAGTKEARRGVHVPEAWSQCRVSMTGTAGAEQVNVTLVGHRN